MGGFIKFLDGVQQNWAGQREIVGGVGLSCRSTICNDQRSLLIPVGGMGGAVSPLAGPGQSPGGCPGAKPLEAPGISHFLVAENGLKYQKILQFTVLQKRPKLHFQCNVSFLSIL